MFFKHMLEDVDRLDQLINHLLDVARMEKDRVGPQAGERATGRGDFGGSRGGLPTLSAARRDDRARSGAGDVCAAPVDLELIFRNLIDNGLKYANEQQPVVEISIRPEGASHVLVEVSDNGRGIPHSLRHLIFGRFVRLGSELEREKPGTGLGLYIVRTMVAVSAAKFASAIATVPLARPSK